MPYDVVNSALKYKGKILDIVHDEITLPNGKTATRDVIVRGNAAAVVPLDADGNVTLVRQYRHGVKQEILEIPAGMLDEGEDMLTCAVRELEEETGLIAGKMEKLMDMHVSVGYCTELIGIYLATDLKEGRQNFDEDEFLELEKYPLYEIANRVIKGELTDSKTIIGIMAAYLRQSQ